MWLLYIINVCDIHSYISCVFYISFGCAFPFSSIELSWIGLFVYTFRLLNINISIFTNHYDVYIKDCLIIGYGIPIRHVENIMCSAHCTHKCNQLNRHNNNKMYHPKKRILSRPFQGIQYEIIRKTKTDVNFFHFYYFHIIWIIFFLCLIFGVYYTSINTIEKQIFHALDSFISNFNHSLSSQHSLLSKFNWIYDMIMNNEILFTHRVFGLTLHCSCPFLIWLYIFVELIGSKK